MNNKTFRFINSLYVIMITNIMALIYLALGLFSFTLVPVIFSVIEVMNELLKGQVDGYSSLVKYFNTLMLKNMKIYKKEELLTGAYSLTLVISIVLLRKVNMPMATSINILLMYIFSMISIYWSYYGVELLFSEKKNNYLNVLVLMFKKPKNLITVVLLFISLISIGVAFKEVLVLFSFSLFALIFVKLNSKLAS
ncbi:MAG: hypothetical protein E6300_04660 [Clostridium sp.]|uniref:hypothetical protein n=1 Tax=Clostridium TaxID=1485 RepID=UPI00115AFF4E|nr:MULTISPECIES: hypothetical protein [Clostridium]MBS5884441.1 hypothetical protein [Clostridium sp.]MDU7147759.1 hypothetical protein [Clostridium sp.]MDU7241650.1 hypothetical protein [Clostridium sp.]